MATTKTTLIQNFESSPLVFSDRHNIKGEVKTINGSVELASANIDATGDIVLLAPISSSAAILSLKLASDNLDSTTTTNTLSWDVGVYNTSGTAVDDNAYADTITLGRGATAYTEYAFEIRGIEETGQRVYKDCSTTTVDPQVTYYIGMHVQAAPVAAASGTLAWIIEYVE